MSSRPPPRASEVWSHRRANPFHQNRIKGRSQAFYDCNRGFDEAMVAQYRIPAHKTFTVVRTRERRTRTRKRTVNGAATSIRNSAGKATETQNHVKRDNSYALGVVLSRGGLSLTHCTRIGPWDQRQYRADSLIEACMLFDK